MHRFINIISNVGPTVNLPDRYGTDRVSPEWGNVHLAHGWRKLDMVPVAPDGKQIVNLRFSQDPGREDYALAAYDTEAIPLPVPDRFPVGVDTPMLVLDTPTGKGVGYVADDTGPMIPIIYAHESPYDMATLPGKIAAARDAAATRRAARIAEAQTARTNANASSNVTALRAEVARLAMLVEAMIGGV